MSTPSFDFLPDDTPALTPEQDLEAAVSGALAVPDELVPTPAPVPIPYGRTWVFDFEAKRFVWSGSSPQQTSGLGAIEQWCLMAIHSTRFAHAVFSDGFGMEDPDEALGEFATGAILSDWTQHLIEALMVHDRITRVENVDLTWDPEEGVLHVNGFDVVTDEDETLTLNDLTIPRSSP